MHEIFKKYTAIVTNINVVNDIAERGAKLMKEMRNTIQK